MTNLLDFSLVKSYFHISPEGASTPLAEMLGTDFLLQPTRVKEMMLMAGDIVHATDLYLPASFFGTSFCSLCCTKLYFLAQSNQIVNLHLDNLLFQIEKHDDHAHLGYKIVNLQVNDVPTDEHADAFVLADWEAYIAETVTPAVEALAEVANVKPSMIWLQFGGIIAMLKDYVEKNETEEIIARFQHYYHLLTEQISAELFNRSKNPFKHTARYIDNPYQPGEYFIMRSACCFYDCRKGGEKCYVCPRLKEVDREAQKAAILASIEEKLPL